MGKNLCILSDIFESEMQDGQVDGSLNDTLKLNVLYFRKRKN